MIGKTNSASGTRVSGSLSITSNGTYDVTEYASAVVNVPSTVEGKLAYVVKDDTEYELTANDTQSWIAIREYAFYYSSKLTSIVVNNVTSIAQSAFAYCTSLITVDLPLVTNIGTYAFQTCPSLKTMYLRASSVCTLAKTNAFYQVTGLTIYVPSDLVSSYETATNWSTLVANNQVTFTAIS